MSIPCKDIIEDIEDLISSQDITPKERYSSRKNITVRSKRKQIIEEIPQPPIFKQYYTRNTNNLCENLGMYS